MVWSGWLAAGLLLISTALVVGWTWLKENREYNYSRIIEIETGWPGRLARFFYFVGLPYLAVITGLITTRSLGLKGLEYLSLIEGGAGLTAQVQYSVVLILLEWWLDSWAGLGLGIAALVVLAGIRLSLVRAGVEWTAGSFPGILAIIYQGLHWAFYRAVFWTMTGDLYLGVILGTGWVIVEWFLVGSLEKTWSGRPQPILVNMMILILIAAIFFYSPNLWLLWPVHLAMAALLQTRNLFQPLF